MNIINFLDIGPIPPPPELIGLIVIVLIGSGLICFTSLKVRRNYKAD